MKPEVYEKKFEVRVLEHVTVFIFNDDGLPDWAWNMVKEKDYVSWGCYGGYENAIEIWENLV